MWWASAASVVRTANVNANARKGPMLYAGVLRSQFSTFRASNSVFYLRGRASIRVFTTLIARAAREADDDYVSTGNPFAARGSPLYRSASD